MAKGLVVLPGVPPSALRANAAVPGAVVHRGPLRLRVGGDYPSSSGRAAAREDPRRLREGHWHCEIVVLGLAGTDCEIAVGLVGMDGVLQKLVIVARVDLRWRF